MFDMRLRKVHALLGGAAAWPSRRARSGATACGRIAVLIDHCRGRPGRLYTRAAAFGRACVSSAGPRGQTWPHRLALGGGDVRASCGGYASEAVASRAPTSSSPTEQRTLSAQGCRPAPSRIVLRARHRSGRPGFISTWGLRRQYPPASPSSNIRFSESRWSFSSRLPPPSPGSGFIFNRRPRSFRRPIPPPFETMRGGIGPKCAARVRHRSRDRCLPSLGLVSSALRRPDRAARPIPWLSPTLIGKSTAQYRFAAIYSYRQVSGRRPDLIRAGNGGHLPALGFVCRSHPARAANPGELPAQARPPSLNSSSPQDRDALRLEIPPKLLALADE